MAENDGGRKRPFTLEQVQLIRASLRAKGDKRELALFEVGISSVLRAGDLLALRARDVTDDRGQVVATFEIKQEKTGEPVRVTLSSYAVSALDGYLYTWDGHKDQRLFIFGRMRYSQFVKSWAKLAHLDPRHYSTHSIRRTYPTHLYGITNNAAIASKLLGHANLTHTAAYLGIEVEEAHAVKRRNEM